MFPRFKYNTIIISLNHSKFFTEKAADAAKHQAMEECKVSEKISDEDLKNLRDHNQPKTKAVKCFITCLGEKSGKVDKFQITFFYIKLKISVNRS